MKHLIRLLDAPPGSPHIIRFQRPTPQGHQQSGRSGQATDEVVQGSVVDNGRGTQYQILQELGAGCFGKVAKVQRMHDGKILAMKIQRLHDQQQVAEIQKEVRLLGGLRHPNIVSFFEDFPVRRDICIVMEFCDGGTLKRYIHNHQSSGLAAVRISGFTAQLAEGLAFIHARNVTHRDLKSENVMMTSRLDVKIADFGCGKVIPEGSPAAPTMSGGDRMIVPPEMSHRLRGVPQCGMVGPAYDMWGLGVILSELVTLKLMGKDRCTQKPLCLNQTAHEEVLREAAHAHGGRFLSLLQGLLERDPARRTTAAEVKSRIRAQAAAPHRSSPQARGPPQPLQRAAATLKVPEAKLQDAWDYFSTADVEGKGYITIDQLKALLVVLNVNVSARLLMKEMGKGIDGTVDFTEFATLWLRRDEGWMAAITPAATDAATEATACRVFSIPPAEFPKLQAAFKRADVDESGDIPFLGLYCVLRDLGINMGPDMSTLTEAVGPDWQERQLTFNEVLELVKEHVDWSSRSLRPRRSPRPRSPRQRSPPSPRRSSRDRPSAGLRLSSPVPGADPQPSPLRPSGPVAANYSFGSKCLVMRSNGEWSPAEVTKVDAKGVTVTLPDGSSKTVPHDSLDRFLKSPKVF